MTLARVAVLSVGDELVLGQIEDTNASWIARALQAIGRMPGERRTIADDCARLAAALGELSSTHDAVVVTGGLGPTRDDLTRDALRDLIDPGTMLEEDPIGIEHLRSWFERRGRPMPESNLRQAMRPRSARLLPNPNGTAPGLAAQLANGCTIFCLPGPPNEMRPMFDGCVAPELRDASRVVLTTALHTIGLGESAIGEQLGELMARDREPSVGTTVSDGVVSIRIRATGTPAEARRQLDATVELCRARVGDIVFARDGETLASVVGEMLQTRGHTLATAESCTGGLLGAMMTEVAGASAWYRGGFIAYENRRKVEDLGVDPGLIAAFGAVSHEAAMAMAHGALRRAGSDLALATTGIAGPGGGSQDKPVGTVYVALAQRGTGIFSRRFHFPGDRATIRSRTARLALACARFTLLGVPTKALLWSEAEAVRVQPCP